MKIAIRTCYDLAKILNVGHPIPQENLKKAADHIHFCKSKHCTKLRDMFEKAETVGEVIEQCEVVED